MPFRCCGDSVHVYDQTTHTQSHEYWLGVRMCVVRMHVGGQKRCCYRKRFKRNTHIIVSVSSLRFDSHTYTLIERTMWHIFLPAIDIRVHYYCTTGRHDRPADSKTINKDIVWYGRWCFLVNVVWPSVKQTKTLSWFRFPSYFLFVLGHLGLGHFFRAVNLHFLCEHELLAISVYSHLDGGNRRIVA